jgi:hypothetical protein
MNIKYTHIGTGITPNNMEIKLTKLSDGWIAETTENEDLTIIFGKASGSTPLQALINLLGEDAQEKAKMLINELIEFGFTQARDGSRLILEKDYKDAE